MMSCQGNNLGIILCSTTTVPHDKFLIHEYKMYLCRMIFPGGRSTSSANSLASQGETHPGLSRAMQLPERNPINTQVIAIRQVAKWSVHSSFIPTRALNNILLLPCKRWGSNWQPTAASWCRVMLPTTPQIHKTKS